MKDAEFNAIELRRSLMDIEFKCDTVMTNLANMKPSEAGRYAFGAVRMLSELAHAALRTRLPAARDESNVKDVERE